MQTKSVSVFSGLVSSNGVESVDTINPRTMKPYTLTQAKKAVATFQSLGLAAEVRIG